MKKKNNIIIALLLIVIAGEIFYILYQQQSYKIIIKNSPTLTSTVSNESGMYSRLEPGKKSSNDSIKSTLGGVVDDQIKDIYITEYYGGWKSLADAKKGLFRKLNDKKIIVSSSPLWNLDMPVQLVGTINYKNGSKGLIIIAQHRVGFQDSSGKSWYFQWDERIPW